MYVVPISQIELAVHVLTRAQHPAAQVLKQYLALYQSEDFSSNRAADAFLRFWEAGQPEALANALQATAEWATPEEQTQISQFRGQAVSSAQQLDKNLRQWFSVDNGFEGTTSAMSAQSQVVAAQSENGDVSDYPRPARYRSIAAGHIRELHEVPQQRLSHGCPREAPANAVVLEQSVYIFVAKCAAST